MQRNNVEMTWLVQYFYEVALSIFTKRFSHYNNLTTPIITSASYHQTQLMLATITPSCALITLTASALCATAGYHFNNHYQQYKQQRNYLQDINDTLQHLTNINAHLATGNTRVIETVIERRPDIIKKSKPIKDHGPGLGYCPSPDYDCRRKY